MEGQCEITSIPAGNYIFTENTSNSGTQRLSLRAETHHLLLLVILNFSTITIISILNEDKIGSLSVEARYFAHKPLFICSCFM